MRLESCVLLLLLLILFLLSCSSIGTSWTNDHRIGTKISRNYYSVDEICPQLDLITYIMITRLISHNKVMFKKYLMGREEPSWRKNFKHNWKELSKKEPSQMSNYLTDSEKFSGSLTPPAECSRQIQLSFPPSERTTRAGLPID